QRPPEQREGDGGERRGGRNRHRRDRDRQRGDQRRDEQRAQQGGEASIAEQQRRIHELESRAEESPQHVPVPETMQEARAAQEAPAYAPPPPPPAPRVEEPRIDAKQLLHDSGLVMVESKAPSQPVTQE